MMYLCLGKREIVWYVDRQLPDIPLNEITELGATGPELEWIRSHFENLPMPRTGAGTWFGDLAKMIAARIPRAD